MENYKYTINKNWCGNYTVALVKAKEMELISVDSGFKSHEEAEEFVKNKIEELKQNEWL